MPRSSQPNSLRTRFRRVHETVRYLQSQGYDVPFLLLLFSLVLTVVFFLALHHPGVELTFDQLTDLESRHYVFGPNISVYLVEMKEIGDSEAGAQNNELGNEQLLKTLSAEEWSSISHDFEFVSILYNDKNAYISSDSNSNRDTEQWIRESTRILHQSPMMPISIVLFPCGCVMHNSWFQNINARFNGSECVALPGFVIEKDYVFWMDLGDGFDASRLRMPCMYRERMLAAMDYGAFADQVEGALDQYKEFKLKLMEGD